MNSAGLALACLAALAPAALGAEPPPRETTAMRARLHDLQPKIEAVSREQDAATLRVNALTRRHEAGDVWAEGPERDQEVAAAEALRGRMWELDKEYSRVKSFYEADRTAEMTRAVFDGRVNPGIKQDLADVGALESFRRAMRKSQGELTRAMELEQHSFKAARHHRARRRSRLLRGAAALGLAAAAAGAVRFWRSS